MPETGSIAYLGVPEAPCIRFENALDPGQKITADFDPMLAKLVGPRQPTGSEAIARSVEALDRTRRARRHHQHRLPGAGARPPGFRCGRACTPASSTEHAARARCRRGQSGDASTCGADRRALGFREFRDIAFGVPEPHATIGQWRN